MIDAAPARRPGPPVAVRPMRERDLAAVEGWLREPHVARWWLAQFVFETEFGAICARVRGEDDPATHMLTVLQGDRAVGLAQWYRWADYPAEAAAMGAAPGEVGLDYAVGDPAALGRGVGTRMIGALVRHVRLGDPGTGFLVGPDAENHPSRAVLERNGFALVAVRPVATEAANTRTAIYRLPPADH